MHDFLLAFIPIFVAVDPLGLLPVFLMLTSGLDRNAKRKVMVESIFTALCLAVGFIVLGKAVFRFLGIMVGDFMVAGGIVLFCIAVMDLLVSAKQRFVPSEDLGAVPLGTPLLVGPAVLTTAFIIIDEYGVIATLVSVFLNIMLAGFIFLFSDVLIKKVGEGGSRALSKVMALLLAAIAVMMIRKGIWQILGLPE
jgi:multiple antibiotic resistance protein